MTVLLNVTHEIWVLVNEMAPYLLLGFLLAGLMHEFVPNSLYRRYLSGHSMKSVVWAALFGIPLPLCSCGVIPTAMGLRKDGASKGATVSFLIATPQTGVDSIIATYSLMGLPFAIVRPLVAMFTAVMGGWLVNATDDEILAVRTPKHVDVSHSQGKEHKSFWQKIGGSLTYAFVEMMEDIGKWLIVGLVIAGLITAVVPDGWFAAFQGNSILSILFVLLLSIPMYLCATGSIPIAVALMLKGLTPGAALVLLMAGPASNAASIMVINKVMGRRTLLVYLASLVSGAILFGLGIDYFLPAEWFTSVLQTTETCCEDGPGWFSIICTLILGLLLFNAFSPVKVWKGGTCACGGHCYEHEEACHRHVPEVTVVHITGMHCNHCAANVQKAIQGVAGVEHVEVSLHEKEAHVTGEFDHEAVLEAVRSIGFEAEL